MITSRLTQLLHNLTQLPHICRTNLLRVGIHSFPILTWLTSPWLHHRQSLSHTLWECPLTQTLPPNGSITAHQIYLFDPRVHPLLDCASRLAIWCTKMFSRVLLHQQCHRKLHSFRCSVCGRVTTDMTTASHERESCIETARSGLQWEIEQQERRLCELRRRLKQLELLA